MKPNRIIKLTCQICGGDLEIEVDSLDKSVTCVHCGKDNLIAPLFSSQIACPICGQKDQIQKVSGLVLTNSPLAQHFRAPDKPHIPSYEDFVRSHLPATITLTTTSSMQKKPFGLLLSFTIIFVLFAVSFLLLMILYILAEEYMSLIYLSGYILLFSGLAVFIGRHAAKAKKHNMEIVAGNPIKKMQVQGSKLEEFRKDYETMAAAKIKTWMHAMREWEILYYCSRDNIIFIPGAGDYAQISGMMTYLNADNS